MPDDDLLGARPRRGSLLPHIIAQPFATGSEFPLTTSSSKHPQARRRRKCGKYGAPERRRQLMHFEHANTTFVAHLLTLGIARLISRTQPRVYSKAHGFRKIRRIRFTPTSTASRLRVYDYSLSRHFHSATRVASTERNAIVIT